MSDLLRVPAIVVISVLFVLATTVRLKWNPFVSLLAAALFAGLMQGMPVEGVISAMTKGFGSVAEGIGIIVALGAMIGVSLEESGAAGSLARKMLQVAGPGKGGLALALIAALVGIPVFADSGFIMLSAPARQMALLQSSSNAVMPLATATGLYSTHVLVPPTPGPLAAAANLGLADALGTVMLVGLATALPAFGAGYWWAGRAGRRILLSQEPSAAKTLQHNISTGSIWVCVLPILLPVLLIMGGNLAKTGILPGELHSILIAAGQPVVALATGTAACLMLPGAHPSGLMIWIGKAINQAGSIVLITAAGGSFGAVLKMLPVDQILGGTRPEAGWWLLPIGFTIAAILKTAQGSSTAAMIIASSLVAPLMIPYGISGQLAPAFLVTAIGGGAMMVSHGNDSFFWVVSRFGGMSMRDTLQGFSLATVWMGLVTLLASCAGWLLLV